MLDNFVYPALLALVTVFSGYAVWLLKENKKIGDANAKGTMLLLRREIIDDYHKFVTQGEPMDPFNFNDIDEIHNAYKALGGNGLTDKMYSELKSLEITNGSISNG